MVDEVNAINVNNANETLSLAPGAEAVAALVAENAPAKQESETNAGISLNETKSSDAVVAEAAGAAADKKPVWQKKPRYNGQQKKRRWEHFNRRDDSDEKRVRTTPDERVKKRKYCMLLGFAGANFFGMQRNPGVNTIEEELLKALLKNKLINDEGFSQPQMIHFQRAARTDKGVSATRQCCSLKLRKYARKLRKKSVERNY